MADYTAVLLLAVTLAFIYTVLHKEHPWIAGLLYIATGGASYLVLSTSNPYGIIIVVVGMVRLFTAPFKKETKGTHG